MTYLCLSNPCHCRTIPSSSRHSSAFNSNKAFCLILRLWHLTAVEYNGWMVPPLNVKNCREVGNMEYLVGHWREGGGTSAETQYSWSCRLGWRKIFLARYTDFHESEGGTRVLELQYGGCVWILYDNLVLRLDSIYDHGQSPVIQVGKELAV